MTRHTQFLGAMVSVTLLATHPAVGQAPTSSKDVRYRTDQFTGVALWEVTLANNMDGHLQARKVRAADGTAAYMLTLYRTGRDWAFLHGPSQWVVDGERLTLGESEDGSPSDQRRVDSDYGGVSVNEFAVYHGLTPAVLDRLARSQVAEFRCPGELASVVGKLDKKGRERLRRFLDAVVTPEERE